VRVSCDLPEEIRRPNPLYVNLTDDRDAAQWDLLLSGCGVNLGASVPDWTSARGTSAGVSAPRAIREPGGERRTETAGIPGTNPGGPGWGDGDGGPRQPERHGSLTAFAGGRDF